MLPAGTSAGQKRKAGNLSSVAFSSSRKRQKFQEARDIDKQTAAEVLTKNGELNIANFIKAREFEIAALDKGMKKARQALSSRAFQQVPRHLRRRTASHNAKRVPRRLQSRAKREMIEDSTPLVNSKTHKPTSRLRLRLETAKALRKLTQKRKTVRQRKREAKETAAKSDPSTHKDVSHTPRTKKNTLAKPPLATSKFKRRQVSKTWLPTHLWHNKRAHMTKAVEPLWRMAIPLRPTEKSYRATHRVSTSRGCIAWDMSYISTLCCTGSETALEEVLKSLGFHGHGWKGPKYEKWKSGSRFATGWVCKNNGRDAISVVDVFWSTRSKVTQANPKQAMQLDRDIAMVDAPSDGRRQKKKLDFKIMIRIHPSAFHQFWSELLHNSKLQKPQVLVEDLRFEIGSIDIMGPGSMEALSNSLELTGADEAFQELWDGVTAISNPALLPLNPVMNFSVLDPRLLNRPKVQTASKNEKMKTSVQEIVVNWPFDSKMQSSLLFSHKARHIAGKLPSQWTLNRRRQTTLPGQPLQVSARDPTIPVILLAHRPQNSSGISPGTWTVLAPWKCIDVIWRRLLHSPLSTGRNPRFGGLRQKQQVAFEQSSPWFPCDYPGTEAGRSWEMLQSETRFDEWIRRPPSRRLAWHSLDLGLNRRGEIGRGWACDWEYLLQDSVVKTSQHERVTITGPQQLAKVPSGSRPIHTQRQRKAARAKAEMEKEEQEVRRRNTSSPESDEEAKSEQHFRQLTPPVARSSLQSVTSFPLPSEPALATVKITLLTKGTPNSAARIYRLPPAELESPVMSSTDMAANTSISADVRQTLDLRSRWLSLDPEKCSRSLSQKMKKEKTNHRGLPNKAQHYELESLRHINVLPKNAPPAIQEQYGAKALSEDEKRTYMERELAIRVKEQKTWDVHIPCPDADDLIGFVTSGGYNLAEGKGIAVGAIWAQKVLKGWATQDHTMPVNTIESSPNSSKQTAKAQMKVKQHRDRERRLCIVRNAGESVGRLAIWEVCE